MIRHVPGATPQDGIAEEADRNSPDASEPLTGDIRLELAPVHGLVQGRQGLGAQERRRKQLVLGPDFDLLTCQLQDDAAIDDESGHAPCLRYRTRTESSILSLPSTMPAAMSRSFVRRRRATLRIRSNASSGRIE